MMHRARVFVTIACLATSVAAHAHSGPPFPIVTDAVRGPYVISIWTDPDATDDGTPGGQFWIVIGSRADGTVVPANTRASVAVRPAGASEPTAAAAASPVRDDVANQFAALVMDHEGPYAVHVEVNGPLGQISVDATVDATYDLRPAPYMLSWYLAPFLLVAFLWSRLLLRRRAAARQPSDRVHLP